MTEKHLKFMSSKYFVDEPGNWHLKEGAPRELQKELVNYLQSLNVIQDEPGTINSIHISYPFAD